jgi:AraC-like DNA-binding protein
VPLFKKPNYIFAYSYSSSNSTVKLNTYIPCDLLKPYVRLFVIQETIEERTYKVFPGTSLVMGFQYKGKLCHLDENVEIPLSAAGITGLGDAYRLFKNSPDTGTVLVFFRDAGAAAFFREPMHLLFGESISLDNFMLRSGLLILQEQLGEAQHDAGRILLVEQFLLSRLRQQEPDHLVSAAIDILYKNKGNIRISDMLPLLHTSQSPLEKRFRKIVGASPKKFASLVRLKHILQSYTPGISFTSLGYEAGFYDQAHFIKEFKSLTGETPEIFFASG